MFDALVTELSERYGLGDRSRYLFGLLLAHIHNDHRGGFTGFIENFREQGHGELVASWFGNSDAGSMNAGDVGTIFGQGLLNDWGGRLGASRATVAAAIAGVLPRLVAELTPGGQIPGGPAPRAVPAESDKRIHVPDPAKTLPTGQRSLPDRLEPQSPTPQPPSPTRSPVEAHKAKAAEISPAEKRVAEMMTAMGNDVPAPDSTGAARPDNWRPAVHPPRKPRRLLGGLFWTIVLLGALAAGGLYAWQAGLLAPLIQQFNLPIRPTPDTI